MKKYITTFLVFALAAMFAAMILVKSEDKDKGPGLFKRIWTDFTKLSFPKLVLCIVLFCIVVKLIILTGVT